MSMMHPGIKVQFELDMKHGDAALRCMQCHRPHSPNTKHPERLPDKIHPPLACGMTIFGESNGFREVSALAAAHNASLVLLLRRNHVARAISAHLHFDRGPDSKLVYGKRGGARKPGRGRFQERAWPRDHGANISWGVEELRREAERMARG
jgi:hypothetical protein